MLVPLAPEQVGEIQQLYHDEMGRLSDADLSEMKITMAEYERSVDFSIRKKSFDIWLRWIASLIFSLAHIGLTYLLIRAPSNAARIGLAVASTLYLAGWVAAIAIVDANGRTSVLDTFLVRIFLECTQMPIFWCVRFLMLFCVAPLTYLIMLTLLRTGCNVIGGETQHPRSIDGKHPEKTAF